MFGWRVIMNILCKKKKKKIQTVSHEPWYEVLSMLAIRLYLIAGLKILPEV